MKRILATISLILFVQGATAQVSVKQSGNVTPGTIPWWITSGVIGGGVTAADSPLTSFGATGPICSLSARQSSGAWNALCIQANAGTSTISLQNFGTASPQALNFIINGTTYVFPGTGSGNVLGPNSTSVGNLAVWNNTAGTLLSDFGYNFGAFTAYTPVLTCGGGGLPASYTTGGSYKILGKLLVLNAVVSITTITGCVGSSISLTLPLSSVSTARSPIAGYNSVGTVPAVLVDLGASTIFINAVPSNGNYIAVNGTISIN